MIHIEGGSFSMGSNKFEPEKPIHQVVLPDFYLGQFPVTNIQYASFLQEYQSDRFKNGSI